PRQPVKPFVSIHVPAYNEPADMMIETLNCLAKLDYEQYEVIVIDNNTPDEATWKPVQAHCEQLGARFKFFHKKPLAGYKAGALNFALEQTDPSAEVVAVIDSDYQVSSQWLTDLTVHFASPEVAIVQAPQDYRDGDESWFKAMCNAEYRGFFHLGMMTRNERNAIIQHGTMTMVRKSALLEAGGWGTTTITEDADLGLKIFELGYEATYTNKSYGQGLIPDTFVAFKKQRYRWAYGAMQILREHAGSLFRVRQSELKPGQRYHYLAGWLPWVADGFNLIFSLMAVIWSILMVIDPITYNAPPMLISLIPIVFFTFKITKMLALYLGEVRAGLGAALAASIGGLSLSYAIGRAVLSGLFVGRKKPFLRTPKKRPKAAFLQALQDAREECLIAAVLTSAIVAVALYVGFDSDETFYWTLVLGVQSVPYWAAVLVSLVSVLPARRRPRNSQTESYSD
ncbi:MAG: glycosyltransferase family 2 protein, partial [Limnobacter sp.]|nr:glycosyltransferase family 2 protein [Limnobacter sp.]